MGGITFFLFSLGVNGNSEVLTKQQLDGSGELAGKGWYECGGVTLRSLERRSHGDLGRQKNQNLGQVGRPIERSNVALPAPTRRDSR